MNQILLLLTVLTLGCTAMAWEDGIYTRQQGDGSVDILKVESDKITLTLSRQVGGPGGISQEGVVPYPTVCRIEQHGSIVPEDSSTFNYEVWSVRLVTASLDNDVNCPEYVDAFNRIAHEEGAEFTIDIQNFKKH